MNTKRFRRTLAVILSLLMVMTVLPLTVQAESEIRYVTSWDELKNSLKTDGEVKLQNDIVASSGSVALTVSKSANVTLDLNGFKIDRAMDASEKQGNVIIVNGKLTVTDTSSDGTGKITGGWTDGTGGGVWVRAGAIFTLAGGTIDGNTASNLGGGVYLSGSKSNFIMTGGAITGNTAKNGGGIGMDSTGSVEISGGTVSGNTARIHGGGAWIGKYTTFTFSGGMITDNNAQWGGGVYVNNGNFEFTGGTISGNNQTHGIDIGSRGGSYRPSFDVNVDCGDGGTVTADKSPADMDDTVTLTVAPDDYYKLKSLTVTAGNDVIPTEKLSDETYTFTMPCSPVTVSASFGELHYISTCIELFNDPYTETGCTLTADKEYAIEGETVTLTFSPAAGYVYDRSDVNYGQISTTKVNDTTYTFIMPDEEASAAVYVRKAEHKVTLAGGASDNVTLLLNYAPKDNVPFYAEYGDTVTVIFHPYDQLISAMTYTYTDTESGRTVTDNIYYEWEQGALEGSFRIPDGDVTVRVEYDEIYNVTEDWDNVVNGLISADVTKAAAGTVVTIAAAPDERYAFSEWHIDPEVQLITDETLANGTRLATFAMPEDDVSFSASFEQAIFDVTFELPDGHGTITGEDWGRAGENCYFTVTPDDGYMAKAVSVLADGEEIEFSNVGNVCSFLMPATDVTVSAQFQVNLTWADLVKALKSGGEIVLDLDYTASENDKGLEVPEGVSAVLDLNGYTVNGDALPDEDVLIVNGELTLTDSDDGGKITGRDGDDVVYVDEGSFTLSEGKIEGVNNDYGGVYVEDTGNFLVSGGEVITTDGSCAVYNLGELIMDDGLISGTGCYSAVYNRSNFRLNGGTVYGDAVDVVYTEGTMIMNGGSITGLVGSINSYGYGIYVDSSAMYISGGFDIDVTEKQFETDPYYSHDVRDFDLYMVDAMIYVTGPLDPDGPQIGLSMFYDDIFAEGAASGSDETIYTLTESDAARFKSKDSRYGILLNGDNQLEMLPLYSVTVADDIENGTVVSSAETAMEGVFVTLTVTPEEGYLIESVTVNGTELEPVDGAYGFEMPDENVTVSAVFTLYVDPDQAAADEVIEKIDAIGTVEYTDACKAKIDDASNAYEALTGTQKALVTNAQTLEDAIARYAELKAAADQAAADQAAADEVIEKIDAIGEVEYTDACKAKIDDASEAFEALTGSQKELVTNAQTLEDAIALYAELKAAADQAAADQAAADEVIAKIDAIGEVEYTDASKSKIEAARDAYDALTGAQKELVTNYDRLTAAETLYADLKADAEKPDEPSQDDGLCKWCGKDHSGNFWQKIVGFFHSILYFFAHLFGQRA